MYYFPMPPGTLWVPAFVDRADRFSAAGPARRLRARATPTKPASAGSAWGGGKYRVSPISDAELIGRGGWASGR